MKKVLLSGAQVGARSLALAALLCGASSAWAATDIEVWHTLNPYNKQVFEKLAKQYNGDQSEVRVKLKAFDNNEAIEKELAAAVKTKKTPNLVQLDETRLPEEVAGRKYITPLYSLLAKHPIKDAKWFLDDSNTFMRDAKGRLLAFPYMVDVPVMYYNIDAFKKAGIKPAEADRSWQGLQDQLVSLANGGSRRCPMVTDQTVSVNLENLAAVNNQPLTSSENGLKGKGDPVFAFDTLFVRHLSLMISWVRTELMLKPVHDDSAVKRFAKNECAVLFSNSSNIGLFKDSRALNFGVSGLPYYPAVTKKPGNPFVTGSALWATEGHGKAADKATASFLGWLAQPKIAADWHQQTGYLPVTDQAFKATGKSYYKDTGHWDTVVAAFQGKPAATSRGFKVKNYPEIREMFAQKLDKALDGKEPAMVTLKSAQAEASRMMKQ